MPFCTLLAFTKSWTLNRSDSVSKLRYDAHRSGKKISTTLGEKDACRASIDRLMARPVSTVFERSSTPSGSGQVIQPRLLGSATTSSKPNAFRKPGKEGK